MTEKRQLSDLRVDGRVDVHSNGAQQDPEHPTEDDNSLVNVVADGTAALRLQGGANCHIRMDDPGGFYSIYSVNTPYQPGIALGGLRFRTADQYLLTVGNNGLIKTYTNTDVKEPGQVLAVATPALSSEPTGNMMFAYISTAASGTDADTGTRWNWAATGECTVTTMPNRVDVVRNIQVTPVRNFAGAVQAHVSPPSGSVAAGWTFSVYTFSAGTAQSFGFYLTMAVRIKAP